LLQARGERRARESTRIRLMRRAPPGAVAAGGPAPLARPACQPCGAAL